MGGVRMRVHVPTLRLDTVLDTMPAPDFVKIDVEGAELLVLDGSAKLISKVRPVFYIEIGSEKFLSAIKLMRSQGYIVLDAAGTEIETPTSSNYFFVPQENREMITSIRALK